MATLNIKSNAISLCTYQGGRSDLANLFGSKLGSQNCDSEVAPTARTYLSTNLVPGRAVELEVEKEVHQLRALFLKPALQDKCTKSVRLPTRLLKWSKSKCTNSVRLSRGPTNAIHVCGSLAHKMATSPFIID
jgi:hypothetical protein